MANIGDEFRDNFFKIKLKPATIKTISAGSAVDRNQWIRVLLLIIQINRLSLNGVNPFIVEHFQKKQIAVLSQQEQTKQVERKVDHKIQI